MEGKIMLNTKVKSIKMIAVVTIVITIVCLALWGFSASEKAFRGTPFLTGFHPFDRDCF